MVVNKIHNPSKKIPSTTPVDIKLSGDCRSKFIVVNISIIQEVFATASVSICPVFNQVLCLRYKMSSNTDLVIVGGETGIAPLKTKRGREFLEYQDYLFNLEKVCTISCWIKHL